MTDLEPKLPTNGDTLTLVADGGTFGIVIPCTVCDGATWITVADPDTGDAMQEWCAHCSGDGVLHQQWHPIGELCMEWANPPKPEGEPGDIPF